MVSFLTELGERIAGLAKGAKKPSAKWVAAFEPLNLVKVSFFGKENSTVRRITRCELQHSPMTLGHLESGLVIACLADVLDRTAKEGIEDDRLFRLVSSCSKALKAKPGGSMPILAYAEFWLLHCMGVLPHSRACGQCGNKDAPFVLLGDQGWLCSACTPSDDSESLPPGSKEYLSNIRSTKAEDMPGIEESHASRPITQLLRDRLLNELGRLKSYDVLFRMVSV